MTGNADFPKPLVQQVVQDMLELEMEELLQVRGTSARERGPSPPNIRHRLMDL